MNPAMFGAIAQNAKMKQKLKASQAGAPKTSEVIIQQPGSPWDGLRATLETQQEGEAIVTLANGKAVSVHPDNLVAAENEFNKETGEYKAEKCTNAECPMPGSDYEDGFCHYCGQRPQDKEKTGVEGSNVKAAPGKKGDTKKKKVVPDDKPDARGDAKQEEDTTDRAKKKSTTKEKPPVLEQMKKGPKSVPVETARTAEDGSASLEKLVASAVEAGEATAQAATDAKEAQKKLGEAKGVESGKIQKVIDNMEKANDVVVKIGDKLVALDEKKSVASVNIPKTGIMRVRYEQTLSLLNAAKAQAKEYSVALKAIEGEAEEQYGADYNVQKRVSLFPASLRASLKMAAGIGDLLNSLLDWAKGVLGIAEDASKAADALVKEASDSSKGTDKAEEVVEEKVEEKVEDKGGEEEVVEKVEEKVEEKKEGE